MPNDKYLDEFPAPLGDDARAKKSPAESQTGKGGDDKGNSIVTLWEGMSRAGLGETVFRAGTHLLSIALILVVVWVMRVFYLTNQDDLPAAAGQAVMAAALPTHIPSPTPPALPPFLSVSRSYSTGIPRLAKIDTVVPSRPRTEVIIYTVQEGDSVFGIAEKFNLKPETILWGNMYILGDNPHKIITGMELNILPVDGIYHKWSAGEGLNGVASAYKVDPMDIVEWEGNNLDIDEVGDFSNPNIEPGTFLLVPGGHREFITWSAPRISRSNPAVARLLGPGSCGTIVDGAVGIGSFIWPANMRRLSGYDYSPATNHFGIDIAGRLGDPIYASDNGVVVYSGWNNWGYGNVVVVDHGEGWQTLYAHMSVIGVGCGQSVFQGDVIGSFGSTGNSSGPHLHFEMLNERYGKVNPWDFLK
jgi:hypothetical protein